MRSSIRSKNLVSKRRRNRLRKVLVMIMAVVAFVLAPSLFSKSARLQIEEIDVRGNKSISTEEVRDLVDVTISGNYLRLYSKSNIFFYPETKIREELLTTFPRIREVKTKLEDFDKLVVELTEREPSALYCENNLTPCFFIDENGFIFDKAPEFTSQVYLVYRTQLNENSIGEYLLSLEELSNIKDFLEGLSVLDLKVMELFMEEGGYVEISLLDGEKILFNLKDDVERAVSNLESILKDPKLGLRSGDRLNVKTIDLRFGNKVFYRK